MYYHEGTFIWHSLLQTKLSQHFVCLCILNPFDAPHHAAKTIMQSKTGEKKCKKQSDQIDDGMQIQNMGLLRENNLLNLFLHRGGPEGDTFLPVDYRNGRVDPSGLPSLPLSICTSPSFSLSVPPGVTMATRNGATRWGLRRRRERTSGREVHLQSNISPEGLQ